MKKLLIVLGMYFISATASAQLKITLVVSSTPPATLTDWANKKEVLTLIINNSGNTNTDVKIKTEIKTTDGTVIATTDLARAHVLSVVAGNTILNAADVVALENMLFTGRYKNTFDKTGKLPADNYMICVQLVKPVDYAPLSENACKSFYLAAIQLPTLMKPYNEEVLNATIAQTAITFRWTPLIPKTTSIITYRLQVFEVLDNQKPIQALRSNQPLLDKEVRAATQYIWQPQSGILTPTNNDTNTDSLKINAKQFIWSIQSLDANGAPVTSDGNGEARSEPQIFYLKKEH